MMIVVVIWRFARARADATPAAAVTIARVASTARVKQVEQIGELGVNVIAKSTAHEHVDERIEERVGVAERVRHELDYVHGFVVRKRVLEDDTPQLNEMRRKPSHGERDRHGGDQEQDFLLLFAHRLAIRHVRDATTARGAHAQASL